MDKERFREILDLLGWSQNECSRIMRRDDRTVRRWASGKNEIDPESAAWLELQAANLPPGRKRQLAAAPDGPVEGISR
jgi:hypothetical protein